MRGWVLAAVVAALSRVAGSHGVNVTRILENSFKHRATLAGIDKEDHFLEALFSVHLGKCLKQEERICNIHS